MMLGQIARRFAARMPAGGFLRHAVAIGSGVALAQAITLLTSPVVSRLYSPAVFGTAATSGSLAAVAAIIASLWFEMAIPIAKDDEEAISLTAASLVCATLFSLFLAAGALVLLPRDALDRVWITGDIWDLRLLIPVLVRWRPCSRL